MGRELNQSNPLLLQVEPRIESNDDKKLTKQLDVRRRRVVGRAIDFKVSEDGPARSPRRSGSFLMEL
jgi:hypothetical protein